MALVTKETALRRAERAEARNKQLTRAAFALLDAHDLVQVSTGGKRERAVTRRNRAAATLAAVLEKPPPKGVAALALHEGGRA